MLPLHAQCEVLVIGAGPIGLFTAIQAKLQHPCLEIALMERLPEYVRQQSLKINPASFDKMPPLQRLDSPGSVERDEAVEELTQLILQMKTKKKIKIHDLETGLQQIATKLHITIHKGLTFARTRENDRQLDREALKLLFPNARLIIGADGAHSKVREVVFGNTLKVDESLQYTIAVKYRVKQSSRPLNKLDAYPAQKLVGSTQEHVGEYDATTDTTPITVQFFVDKETFDKLKNYRAGNPLPLDELKQIDETAEENIRTWLGVRAERVQDKIEGHIEVYTIRLPSYQSQEVVKKEGDRTFFLVGDALFGVPFYRAINNGFLCSSKLSKTVVKLLKPPLLSPPPLSLWKQIKRFVYSLLTWHSPTPSLSPEQSYAFYADRLATTEIRNARIKNAFLNLYQWFIAISARVPWQVNRWSPRDIDRFTEFNPTPIA